MLRDISPRAHGSDLFIMGSCMSSKAPLAASATAAEKKPQNAQQQDALSFEQMGTAKAGEKEVRLLLLGIKCFF